MNAQADEALRLGQSLIEGLKGVDADHVISLLHKDIVLEVVFPFVKGEDKTGCRYQRGDAVREYVRDAKRRSAAIRFKNEHWHSTTDGWAIFRSDADNVLADGTPYPQSYLFMFEVRDGKITRWLEYMNPVCAVRALGAPLESLPYAT
jgi:ketosteroid isomerase-like protein